MKEYQNLFKANAPGLLCKLQRYTRRCIEILVVNRLIQKYEWVSEQASEWVTFSVASSAQQLPLFDRFIG